MFKILRRLRQNSLTGNNFSKYLLYATGEIILVVFGILVALQINNWNQSNKDFNTEQDYLQNLIRDLNQQLVSVEEQILAEGGFFDISQEMLENYYQLNRLVFDSIFFDNGSKLAATKTFIINDPTYTDLISSGNIKLIKDSNKRDQIIQYYQDLERVERIIQNNNSDFVDGTFASIYLKFGYLSPGSFQGAKLLKKETKLSSKLSSQSKKLKKLSAIAIKDGGELELINAISMRHVLSAGHLTAMETVKKLTQSLIEALSK